MGFGVADAARLGFGLALGVKGFGGVLSSRFRTSSRLFKVPFVMSPQPLSRVKSKAKFGFPGNALQQRPKLSTIIAQIIGRDAATEHRLSLILVDVLRADPKTAIAMYQSVQSSEARRAMLSAAVKARLRPDDRALFDAVLKAIAPSRRVRHSFAHHIWGLSPELPEALLLVDPADLLRFDADAAEVNRKMGIEAQAIPLTPLNRSKVMVWKKRALDAALRNADDALGTVAELEWSFHWWSISEINVQIRKLLLNRPSVASCLLGQGKDSSRPKLKKRP